MGPPESGSWAVSPSLLSTLSWQAAESDTELRSHQGNEAGMGGTEAGKRENRNKLKSYSLQHHLSETELACSYLPLDLGDVRPRGHDGDIFQRNSKG